MGTTAAQEGLLAAGAAFGLPPAAPAEPRWSPLFAALDGGDAEYETAVELIYEGYLLHYREPRLAVADDAAARLLAGDFFYARGLRFVAARGDADAVGLLARLMVTCSCLRALAAPFAADDALWAYTMGGLAALRRGCAAALAASLFDEVDAGLAVSGAADVGALTRAAVPRLALPDTAPLLKALATVPAAAGSVAASRPAAPAAAHTRRR